MVRFHDEDNSDSQHRLWYTDLARARENRSHPGARRRSRSARRRRLRWRRTTRHGVGRRRSSRPSTRSRSSPSGSTSDGRRHERHPCRRRAARRRALGARHRGRARRRRRSLPRRRIPARARGRGLRRRRRGRPLEGAARGSRARALTIRRRAGRGDGAPTRTSGSTRCASPRWRAASPRRWATPLQPILSSAELDGARRGAPDRARRLRAARDRHEPRGLRLSRARIRPHADPAHRGLPGGRAVAARPRGRSSPRSKRSGATTVFFETLVSPKLAETVAREAGAETAVLDPLEGLTEDEIVGGRGLLLGHAREPRGAPRGPRMHVSARGRARLGVSSRTGAAGRFCMT